MTSKNLVVVEIENGCVLSTTGPCPTWTVDYDLLEDGECPICRCDLDDNYCEECDIDWDDRPDNIPELVVSMYGEYANLKTGEQDEHEPQE